MSIPCRLSVCLREICSTWLVSQVDLAITYIQYHECLIMYAQIELNITAIGRSNWLHVHGNMTLVIPIFGLFIIYTPSLIVLWILLFLFYFGTYVLLNEKLKQHDIQYCCNIFLLGRPICWRPLWQFRLSRSFVFAYNSS